MFDLTGQISIYLKYRCWRECLLQECRLFNDTDNKYSRSQEACVELNAVFKNMPKWLNNLLASKVQAVSNTIIKLTC